MFLKNFFLPIFKHKIIQSLVPYYCTLGTLVFSNWLSTTSLDKDWKQLFDEKQQRDQLELGIKYFILRLKSGLEILRYVEALNFEVMYSMEKVQGVWYFCHVFLSPKKYGKTIGPPVTYTVKDVLYTLYCIIYTVWSTESQHRTVSAGNQLRTRVLFLLLFGFSQVSTNTEGSVRWTKIRRKPSWPFEIWPRVFLLALQGETLWTVLSVH